MRVGIIGLGQSGKSSIFYSMTGQPLEPPSGKPRRRLGRATIPEPRVDLVAKLDNSKKTSYPEIVFIDPEGFPADVAKSLSAEMLGMVRNADLLALVIRAFPAPAVMHPSGSVDGARDIEICFGDLIIQDLAVLEVRHKKVLKEYERGKRDLKRELKAIEKSMALLGEGKFLRQGDLADIEKEQLESFELLTMKDGIIVWNVDEKAEFGSGGRGIPEDIKGICDEYGWGAGAASLAIETEIMEMDSGDRKEFLDDLGIEKTIQDRFLTAVYKRLGLITFFTGGPKEAAARPIPTGTTAFNAAGKVHNDIQRGFIRAEVMSFIDLVELGSVDAVRKAGKYRLEKKEYIVQDGDIIHFRFNI
jgi:GTP-binding protein YchF